MKMITDVDLKYRLRVAWAAHRGAPATTASDAEEHLGRFLARDTFTMTDDHPDVILFMSGGSEKRAVELADPGKPVLLLSVRGNNAYAAATEAMARMINNGMTAMLSDISDAAESGLLAGWQRVAGAWESLNGMRAGLIGTVSEWLVASDVSAETLKNRMGVTLKGIPWERVPDYALSEPDVSLLSRFSVKNTGAIEEAARVLTMLRQIISGNDLQAIGVECFSLVQQRKVTACLALAQLNTEGTVAACEGDLASMAGMLAGKALTGTIPWMANTTRLTEKTVILSHCTAPFDLVSEVTLPSHFETGYSLAVDGNIPLQEVTLFRFSEKLDRVFLEEGTIISRPRLRDACRTQVEIEMPPRGLGLLRNRPLGNHLLMIPGRHSRLLELAFRYKGFEVLT